MTEYQTVEHDVLVIGAGGAGLRAAIEAAALGSSVRVTLRVVCRRTATILARESPRVQVGSTNSV